MARIVKQYRVVANLTREVVYLVDAVSPEEAEVIAEDYIADGEEPLSSTLVEIQFDEVLPADDDATGHF
jgi:hypothetical protein